MKNTDKEPLKESFEIKETFNATPAEIYRAWLNSDEHSEMTGGVAKCGKNVGDAFTAWDGYITGVNLKLTLNKEIIQSWRTNEFLESDSDSKLAIQLKEKEHGTELTLTHSNIPSGQKQYEQGWKDHYFAPMKAFFNNYQN